jgi:hypothetical protein
MTMLSIFPVINLINILCCAGIALGGFAGVFFYRKQLTGTGLPLTTKDGGMIGILSGILAAVLVSGFTVLAGLLSHINPMTEVVKVLEETGFSIPSEMQVHLERFSEEYNKFGFSPTIAIFSFFLHLILFPLFGAIGAILGVSVLGKKYNAGPGNDQN